MGFLGKKYNRSVADEVSDLEAERNNLHWNLEEREKEAYQRGLEEAVMNSKPKEDALKTRGCLLAGPGRGDCSHFIGLPFEENDETTDEYGRPHGWCEICWQGEIISRLSSYLRQSLVSYGGEQYANHIMAYVLKEPGAKKE